MLTDYTMEHERTHYPACLSPLNKGACFCPMLDVHDPDCWKRQFHTVLCNCSLSLLLHDNPEED